MKPQWQAGASQPIKLRKTGATAAGPAAKAAPPVKLWGGALEMDDDELVDDDELLTEEDLQRPQCQVRLAFAPSWSQHPRVFSLPTYGVQSPAS